MDVIVCTAGRFKDLYGAVINSVLNKAGDSIKEQCKSIGDIAPGEVVATGAGNLAHNKCIYHVELEPWNHSQGYKVQYKVYFISY